MTTIYLAGPDVFARNAVQIGAALKDICKKYGFTGLYPLDSEVGPEPIHDPSDPLEMLRSHHNSAYKIFQGNLKLIGQSDIVVANLLPFRGPSADAGTIWECGYAKGLGKPVIGYNIPFGTYRTRVLGNSLHDGCFIEDFQLFDNLMIAYGTDNMELVDITKFSHFDFFESTIKFIKDNLDKILNTKH